MWPQVIKKKVFKFVEFVFGASEVQTLCVEYPSVYFVTLEDERQVVDGRDHVVHGRIVRQFWFVSPVFQEVRSSLSVWLPRHRI